MLTIFGKKLKELRIERENTQQQLADIFNVSKTTICQWETHKQEPSLEDVVKIAKYFDVTIDYLCGLEENSSNKIKNTVMYQNSVHNGDNKF